MAELTTRPYADADAAALTHLMREIAIAAGADPGLTEESVRSWFSTGLVRDPGTDTRLVVQDGAIVAAAMLAPPRADGDRVDCFGGVMPDWRGRGLGRELLRWSVGRARQLRDMLAPGDAWTFDADAYSTETAALHLFERVGMQPVRYWYEMRADLGRPARPLPRPDLPVIAFAAGYAAALHEAWNDAMADHVDSETLSLADWSRQELYLPGFRPDLTRLALHGDTVAAYVMVGEETPGRVRINGVGTRRAWRRQGLAGALLAEAMQAAADDGQQRASLGVDSESPTGAVSIYQRAGFEVRDAWISYRMALA